jgi:hypothetical protein
MAVLNRVLAEAANLVVRAAVELQARQMEAVGEASPTNPGLETSSSLIPSATSSSTAFSTTVPQPTPTSSTSFDDSQRNERSGTSPLLFFVALGFGVVFTNLW